jgi:lantibiotic modifying enzyme
MAWALSELAASTGEARFRNAASEAISFERSLFATDEGNWPDLRPRGDRAAGDEDGAAFMVAWCHGAPGIALARLKLLEQIDSDETRAEIDVALRTTLARGFGDNHSLCHGDLGNLEPLLQAGEVLHDPRMAAECLRVAAAILEDIRRTGWLCGTPLGVETPGLMIGLAGIGYGMLRLAEPDRVPSVLILEPPRRPAIRLGSKIGLRD